MVNAVPRGDCFRANTRGRHVGISGGQRVEVVRILRYVFGEASRWGQRGVTGEAIDSVVVEFDYLIICSSDI